MAKEQDYQIIITSRAEQAYFEVLDYIFDNHSFQRANEIALELVEHPQILRNFPLLGQIEPNLEFKTKKYRYILYERTKVTTVKIIYFIHDTSKQIYITDFFPCEMFEQRMKRNL